MKAMNIVTLLVVAGALCGCRQDQITSTWVPKEKAPSAMGIRAMPAEASPGHRELDWTLPSGWTEQTPGPMRLGSFLAMAPNGQSVDISVVPLSGEAGGLLANINRWRGQINLPPAAESEIAGFSEKIAPGKRAMLLVNFASDELLVDGKKKKRIMAAIYEKGGQTWFFKMMGEDEAVRSQKAALLRFLESLRFHEH